jgi:hypothetical protein
MIKLYYHSEYFNSWSSELVLLYADLINKIKIDDNRFNQLKNHNHLFEYVNNIELCDFVVLPYKWRGMDLSTKSIINDCLKFNKKILVFFNDDSHESIPISPEQGYIFRTSFFKSKKKDNEFSLPAFIDDNFNNEYIEASKIDLNIGFCGFDHYERKKSLEIIKNDKRIKSNFIIRNSFWAGGINKETAILEFNQNLKNNLFNFSCRGSGNFSYRFYEILSMGKIPVLLNTDCVLPFDNSINYYENCVIVDISEINNISEIIVQFYEKKTKEELLDIQIKNRLLYEKKLSPKGFIETIYNFLKVS